jgi:hypothetical protein
MSVPENGNLIWEKGLSSKEYKPWTEKCYETDNKGYNCGYWESCLQVSQDDLWCQKEFEVCSMCENSRCDSDPIDPPNPFPFLPKPPRPTEIKIMVAGDSISHGMENDFTWPYRLGKWCK